MHILIIEDNPDVHLLSLASLLRPEGEVRLAVKLSEGGDAETLSASLKDVELLD